MSMPAQKRQKAEAAGRFAEMIAALYLRAKGFRVLERRFRCHSGEIDLIVKRGSLVAFVEVKRRASIDDALYAVSGKSRQRIERAAEFYMSRQHHLVECDWRYDILAVSGRGVRHLGDAWRPSA